MGRQSGKEREAWGRRLDEEEEEEEEDEQEAKAISQTMATLMAWPRPMYTI